MLRRMFIVIGLLVATGCGHAPVSTSGASAKNVACYFGESRMVRPDGRRVSKYQTLLRRVLMPEKSLVGEAVAAMIPNRPRGIHRIGTVVEPDGTFRFKETQSGATGTGKFEGEPWRWHGWTSTAQLASKVVVKTRVTLKDGVLRSTKTVLGAKDKLKFTITDHLKEIGHTECERRFLRLKHEVSTEKEVRCKAACSKLKTCESDLELKNKDLNSMYCQDRCMKGEQSRAFRCVMAVSGNQCSELAGCVRGRDIN